MFSLFIVARFCYVGRAGPVPGQLILMDARLRSCSQTEQTYHFKHIKRAQFLKCKNLQSFGRRPIMVSVRLLGRVCDGHADVQGCWRSCSSRQWLNAKKGVHFLAITHCRIVTDAIFEMTKKDNKYTADANVMPAKRKRNIGITISIRPNETSVWTNGYSFQTQP